MTTESDPQDIRFALPKGRMQAGVFSLLSEAGIEVQASDRGYRPSLSVPGFQLKLLKPQNIVEMLHAGSRDVGFAGADWVRELDVDLVELADTDLDPVRIVAAAPREFLTHEARSARKGLRIASEYERLTRSWIEESGLDARFLRTFGATEVFPPEDADMIVDNTATGSTLAANGLEIVDEVMRSTTRLYANPKAMDDPRRREMIEDLTLLVKSVIEARGRVLFDVNVPADRLDAVCAILPCMDRPTIAALVGDDAFAIRAAVPRKGLAQLVSTVKANGGTDIVVTRATQIVP